MGKGEGGWGAKGYQEEREFERQKRRREREKRPITPDLSATSLLPVSPRPFQPRPDPSSRKLFTAYVMYETVVKLAKLFAHSILCEGDLN